MEKQPESPEYLREIATRYGNLFRVDQFQDFVANLTNEQSKELALAYEEIAARSSNEVISRWIHACCLNRDPAGREMAAFATAVGQLVLLFHYLGEAGIPPFSSYRVRSVDTRPPLCWEKLPAELQYLVGPAEELSVIASIHEAGGVEPTARQLKQLARIRSEIDQRQHWVLINTWINEYPFPENQESWMVYCLVGAMDECLEEGIPW